MQVGVRLRFLLSVLTSRECSTKPEGRFTLHASRVASLCKVWLLHQTDTAEPEGLAQERICHAFSVKWAQSTGGPTLNTGNKQRCVSACSRDGSWF